MKHAGVFAHYARGKAFAVIGLIATICVFLFDGLRSGALGMDLLTDQIRLLLFTGLMGALIAPALLLLYQVLFHGGAALWRSSDGDIICLDAFWFVWFARLPRYDIAAVETVDTGNVRDGRIIFRMTDGKSRAVRTFLLAEPASMIVSRLRSDLWPVPVGPGN